MQCILSRLAGWCTVLHEAEFNYTDFDKGADEWYPCEQNEQSTQEVFLNFSVDQITWNNSELAVCDIFKVGLNSETAEAKQSELNVCNQEKLYTSVPDTGQECISVPWVISPKLVLGT